MPLISVRELDAWKGREVGLSDWIEVDQARIDRFAEVTDDHQYIHVDPERASRTPIGGTISHGLLTLSLLPAFLQDVALELEGSAMVFNYGYDRVRFLEPVRSGSRLRARLVLLDAVEKQPERWLLQYDVSIEIAGRDTPAMIAVALVMIVLE